jgi:hypothetical protein
LAAVVDHDSAGKHLRGHPAADAVGAFEHQHVGRLLLQRQRRRQARVTCADDDDRRLLRQFSTRIRSAV